MYIEFESIKCTKVMPPYGSFTLIIRKDEYFIADLNNVKNYWEVTEEEFRRVQQEIRDITDLQKKNLNCLYVQARVTNEY